MKVTLDEEIRWLKKEREHIDVSAPRMDYDHINQLIGWLEDYKQLKADYIDLDRQLRDANSRADIKWVKSDIFDPMPDANKIYLVIKNGNYFLARYYNDIDHSLIAYWHDEVYDEITYVDYWLMIPQPPKGDTNDSNNP